MMFKNLFISFFNTIGRILAYLFIAIIFCLLFGSCDVHALGTYKDFKIPNQAGMYNLVDNSNINKYSTASLVDNSTNYEYKVIPFSQTYTYASLGTTLAFDTEVVFEKDREYTVQIAVATAPGKTDTYLTFGGVPNYIWNVQHRQSSVYNYNKNNNVVLIHKNFEYSEELINSQDLSNVSVLTYKFKCTFGGYNTILVNLNASKSSTMYIYFLGYKITEHEINYKTELQEQKERDEEAEKTRKSILQTIKDLPQTLIDLLLNALKSLFIPTDSQLEEIINSSTSLASNFGFIGQSIDFFIQLINVFINAVSGNGCITIPSFEVSYSYFELKNLSDMTFWESSEYCLVNHGWLGDDRIITIIRSMSSITLIILILNYSSKQFHKIFSKESD